MVVKNYTFVCIFILMGCSQVTEQGDAKIITDSTLLDSKFTFTYSPKTNSDTVKAYLSKFDLSNCKSIKILLGELYRNDQSYRDSAHYYGSRNHKKQIQFYRKMTVLDNINQKILENSIQDILKRLECLDKPEEIDAIWLVAHHGHSDKLRKAVKPAVDYAFKRKFMQKDSYNLYYQRLK